MNIISYNLNSFQQDNKLNNKQLALKLSCDVKEVRQMKKENYQFNKEQITKIASLLMISEEKLQTEMHERINLKEKKIYGTDYLFVNYQVLNYKSHNINLISCIFDLLFFVMLALFLITKQIVLTNDFTSFLNILKIIFVVELLVFPFMFIALPVLKIYFNRTYEAVLTSNIKEYYHEEACGIITSCLRRSISKSFIPYVFTIFSELVIALYSLFTLLYIKKLNMPYLIMVILFITSFIISMYSFKYQFGKYKSVVKKGIE